MAIQSLSRRPEQTRLGEILQQGLGQVGQGFGTGLSSGLQALANMQLQDIAQQKARARLLPALQAAKLPAEFADLPEAALVQAFKQQQQQNLARQEYETLKPLLNQLLPGQAEKGELQVAAQQPVSLPEEGSITPGKGPEFIKLIQGMQEAERRKAKEAEELALKKKEIYLKEQAPLRPFLKNQAADYTMANKVNKVAKRMLDNLRKNKEKWPTISGVIPSEELQKIIQRDPDVRNYMKDARTLAQLQTYSLKGQPTNFKLKFQQSLKPELSEPIETQEQNLLNIIEDTEDVFDTSKYIEKVKKENEGDYPGDIEQRVVEYEEAKRNPLSYPEYYQEGTKYQDDDGTIYTIVNGEWK